MTVLVYTKSTYNRPNRHPMAESFHLLEGKCDVIFFTDDGKPDKILHMEAAVRGNGHPYIVQFPIMVYHTIIVRSDWLVIHETCCGPFVRGETTRCMRRGRHSRTDAHDVTDFLGEVGRVLQMTSRRGFITGLISFVAAPAIVRASSIMPVRSIKMPLENVFQALVQHPNMTATGRY